ncbi:MAG: Lrp/AsnC family transcriptional regulator [Thermoplasmata archaeon]|jgi:DNA-binding Lrp family transcriptional regulator
MDPLDFAIYRYLSPRGEGRFWAGRRLIDPTIPARAIAEQVGISENGVRARLRGLAERGYLRDRSVVLNPSLFGVQVFVAELPLAGTAEAERVFRDLALVEGVVFARDTLDEGDRLLRVHFVSDGESTINRRAALIRRLSPKGELRAPQLYHIPPCERELSPLDWKLLQTYVQHPDASVAEVGKIVRISLKTAARRYHELVESRACAWTHGPKSEEFPLALIRAEVSDSNHRASAEARVLRESSTWMPVASDGLGLDPASAATVFAGLVPADAPTAVERIVSQVIGLPGVTNVRRTFALGSRTYPDWYAERIAERVAGR